MLSLSMAHTAGAGFKPQLKAHQWCVCVSMSVGVFFVAHVVYDVISAACVAEQVLCYMAQLML